MTAGDVWTNEEGVACRTVKVTRTHVHYFIPSTEEIGHYDITTWQTDLAAGRLKLSRRPARFRVLINNVGAAHEGDDPAQARQAFDQARHLSQHGAGRAAGERVVLLDGTDDRILADHPGNYSRPALYPADGKTPAHNT